MVRIGEVLPPDTIGRLTLLDRSAKAEQFWTNTSPFLDDPSN